MIRAVAWQTLSPRTCVCIYNVEESLFFSLKMDCLNCTFYYFQTDSWKYLCETFAITVGKISMLDGLQHGIDMHGDSNAGTETNRVTSYARIRSWRGSLFCAEIAIGPSHFEAQTRKHGICKLEEETEADRVIKVQKRNLMSERVECALSFRISE